MAGRARCASRGDRGGSESDRGPAEGACPPVAEPRLILQRRLTIKFAMWEELRLLARLSTLLSVAIRTLATDEGQYAEQQSSLWSLLSDHLGALA